MYKTISKAIIATSIALLSSNIYSQVGVGTTTPNADALLDVDATATPG